MNSNYRITHRTHPDSQVVALWQGNEQPDEATTALVADSVRRQHKGVGHDGMLQRFTDILNIERRRRFGWRVVECVNIYRDSQ